ncbi:hypothetical protein ACTVPR_09320, partial [Limosilactobacillus fermentum]|uniref:hypothetical protein n=1 Tax=Limosilactobacillus fermentum TaxID=1613 RepID=UPI003FA57EC6
ISSPGSDCIKWERKLKKGGARCKHRPPPKMTHQQDLIKSLFLLLATFGDRTNLQIYANWKCDPTFSTGRMAKLGQMVVALGAVLRPYLDTRPVVGSHSFLLHKSKYLSCLTFGFALLSFPN